jgi:hypothetical protein
MSRSLLILALLLVLVPAEAGAHGRRFEPYRWPTDTVIVVENRLGPRRNEAVEQIVASWHQAYPSLRFKVIHRKGACRWREGRIVLCRAKANPTWVGYGNFRSEERTITAGLVRIADPNPANRYILCHELGHTLGLTDNRHVGDSCLADYDETRPLETPGPFDRDSLRLLYGRTGPKWP